MLQLISTDETTYQPLWLVVHCTCTIQSLYLSQTFLSSPHRCVNDLEEELASPGVEDENSSVDWLCGQVTLKRLLRDMKNRQIHV